MTRDQAARILHPDTSREAQEEMDATMDDVNQACVMGAEALRTMREPRSETGIVTCGCGGIGQLIYDADDGREIYCIRCIVCKIKSRWCSTGKEAIRVWNKAMGWRGEE